MTVSDRGRLGDLDAGLQRTVFAAIAGTRNSKDIPQSATAMDHLRNTLRTTLDLAVKEGVLECNPAQPGPAHRYQRLPAAPCQGLN